MPAEPGEGHVAPTVSWMHDRRSDLASLWRRLSHLHTGQRLRRLDHPLTVAVVSWAVLVALFVPAVTRPGVRLAPGQVSPVDIEAPRTIENRYQTRQLQQQAVKDALRRAAEDPANYSIDPTAAVQAGDRVRKALALIAAERERLWQRAQRSARPGAPPDANYRPPAAEARERAGALQSLILQQANLALPTAAVTEALRMTPTAFMAVHDQVPGVVEHVMSSTRIASDGVEAAQGQVDGQIGRLKMPPEAVPTARTMARAALMPNLILDPGRIERLRQEAIRSVQPVMVVQHQVILRRGDVVTEEHVELLSDLGLLGRSGRFWSGLLGASVLLALLVGMMALYVARFHPKIARSTRMAALVASLALVAAVSARILEGLRWAPAGYLAPVAFSGMLATLLLDARLGAGLVSALSVLMGLLFGFSERHVLVSFVTGMTAVFNVHRLSQRSDLTRTGVVSGVAGLATLGALGLMQSDPDTVVASWAGLANGVLSSILALGLLPFVETLFGAISTVRLMELSNPNQPLLRRLLLEAPGTYHHSLMVGNLAEAAAEAVGGDPVLCRTGALYHDVGKVRRPYFFVENQFGDANPHERLMPSLSTLIIMSHVKDGVELARQAGLPEGVVDFIRTHHGTDLVRYFYMKAVQAEGAEKVNERDYRYPGPKPHTKETAIVMLADSVEASARSLTRPTPGRIEGLVRKVIRERLLDGQLDESTLTLQELNDIGSAFVKILTGIYHARIEYPELERQEEARRA
ncbi:HDIG domain-containing protein [Carboxydochorda subterranea]|uniref:HDIG domain-containing protein n=1 Tax=Carboxydichorda subterranea TaxID=3109565 RepID=A0ABZ1C1X8_9FIRM|nr:HDIG domain-containing metalloprotein [Limnochorda sp. L945t]WRP18283.1 HDIG domain-containing protein [Limnochorda sp. L945t]